MFQVDKSTYKLADGHEMPMMGFGTYKLDNPDLMNKTIATAYESGYRMFDTAQYYRNEKCWVTPFETLPTVTMSSLSTKSPR